MSRFLKSYSLPYRRLPGGSARVAGHTATMSSYAGAVFSVDDFMTLSSGLVTTETSLIVYNTELFKLSQPRGQVKAGSCGITSEVEPTAALYRRQGFCVLFCQPHIL